MPQSALRVIPVGLGLQVRYHSVIAGGPLFCTLFLRCVEGGCLAHFVSLKIKELKSKSTKIEVDFTIGLFQSLKPPDACSILEKLLNTSPVAPLAEVLTLELVLVSG